MRKQIAACVWLAAVLAAPIYIAGCGETETKQPPPRFRSTMLPRATNLIVYEGEKQPPPPAPAAPKPTAPSEAQ